MEAPANGPVVTIEWARAREHDPDRTTREVARARLREHYIAPVADAPVVRVS